MARPRRTHDSNEVLRLSGTSEDHDLWVTIYSRGDGRLSDEDPMAQVPCITSVWELTDEERMAVALGANIDVTVYGDLHPALSVSTTKVALGRAPA